jgi:hypothetical protein
VNDAPVIELLDESHDNLEEDEGTVIENFDVNQLIEYDEDDETVSYNDEEEEIDDEETIPDVHPRHITDEMKKFMIASCKVNVGRKLDYIQLYERECPN